MQFSRNPPVDYSEVKLPKNDVLQITTANNQCCEMHLSRAAERRSKKKGKRASKSDSSSSNCCEGSKGGHTLKFGSVAEIGYVVRSGVVFLVKCSAFAALGRMYVIRGSDYRDDMTQHMMVFHLANAG